MTKKDPPASKPIPIRFSPEQLDRMDRMAARLGMTRSGLAKVCLKLFLDRFEADSDVLSIDWEKMLIDLDGRTHRYSGKRGNKES